jgi:hypothetical protein
MTWASVSERLIRVLPPAFLVLLLLNMMFLAVITWLFNHNVEARTVMLTQILEKCLQHP